VTIEPLASSPGSPPPAVAAPTPSAPQPSSPPTAVEKEVQVDEPPSPEQWQDQQTTTTITTTPPISKWQAPPPPSSPSPSPSAVPVVQLPLLASPAPPPLPRLSGQLPPARPAALPLSAGNVEPPSSQLPQPSPPAVNQTGTPNASIDAARWWNTDSPAPPPLQLIDLKSGSLVAETAQDSRTATNQLQLERSNTTIPALSQQEAQPRSAPPASTTSSTAAHLALTRLHAALMIIAFGVLLPLSALLTRAEFIGPCTSAQMGCQLAAVGLAIVSIAVAAGARSVHPSRGSGAAADAPSSSSSSLLKGHVGVGVLALIALVVQGVVSLVQWRMGSSTRQLRGGCSWLPLLLQRLQILEGAVPALLFGELVRSFAMSNLPALHNAHAEPLAHLSSTSPY